jgi:hypothetical protein
VGGQTVLKRFRLNLGLPGEGVVERVDGEEYAADNKREGVYFLAALTLDLASRRAQDTSLELPPGQASSQESSGMTSLAKRSTISGS